MEVVIVPTAPDAAAIVVHEAAAAGLRLAGYYRDVLAGKPAWQAL